ncbi:MAG: polyprenyl synthetase family protein [bacterium]|nr:polyprenyl synthetase family protein [bacterium]
MTFQESAKKKRPVIEKRLQAFISEYAPLSEVSPWGEDVKKRLLAFVNGGKLLRGCLILLAHEMYGGKNETDAITLAAAIELFHSSFLIHDDIMDQDSERRGKPTFFAQYAVLANKQKLQDAKHTGESLATCVGDVGFFLGFALLNEVSDTKRKMHILQTISSELTLVGLGQMQDVALGAGNTTPTEEEIMQVYRYKTARYTFSLPLMLGATLAGASKKNISLLTNLGETVGLIFQIRDDELNIFGDEKITGKPIGSDIREGKKTLFYHYLFQKADKEMTHRLNNIFGNPALSTSDIAYVQECIKKTGVKKMIEEKKNKHQKQIIQEINRLEIEEGSTQQLHQLLELTLSRTR